MSLIETIIDATLRKIIDGSSDREDGSIHGVVVSDAYGNKPMNVWTPGTSGISLRTDDGEVVPVLVRQYDLMPPRALCWSIGDTLTIEGRMEKQNATCVFHDAVVRVTSQPAIERTGSTARSARCVKRNSGVNRGDKVNSRPRVAFSRISSIRPPTTSFRPQRPGSTAPSGRETCIGNP